MEKLTKTVPPKKGPNSKGLKPIPPGNKGLKALKKSSPETVRKMGYAKDGGHVQKITSVPEDKKHKRGYGIAFKGLDFKGNK